MVRWRPGSPGRLVTEVVLLCVMCVVLAAGSVTAAARQVPPRVPLDWAAWSCMAAAVALLPLRYRFPLAVLVCSAVVGGVYLALGYPYGPVFIAVGVASYRLAAVATLRRTAVGLCCAVAVLIGAQVFPLRMAGLVSQLAILVLAWSAWVGVPAWIAANVRQRRAYQANVAERRKQQERAEREHRQREAAEQRLAISRDVHDLVAHSLSLITLQAGTALHIFDRQPEEAKAAVSAIRESSVDALRDLRRVIAHLRRPDELYRDDASLAELADLVDRIRHDALEVALYVDGAVRPLPAPVQTCAYRVVQESLTNVIRHAKASRVTVRLSYQDDGLAVEVIDDGVGTALNATPGHGIAGMRDRAIAVGGSVTTSRATNGGFAVRAWLPAPGTT